MPLAHNSQSWAFLLRAQSGRERLLLAHPRNYLRRISTEEIEAVQLTQAQVEHNYARSKGHRAGTSTSQEWEE